MNVLYILISGKAGGDVYFERLHKYLNAHTNIKSDIIFINSFFEKIPFLIPLYMKFKTINFEKYDIIHSNAEFGHYFKIKDKPLFVTIHHSVFDKNYQKYTSYSQKLYYKFWIKPNLKKSLRIADKIIAVSNYTKEQIIKDFPFCQNEIITIYNGIYTQFFRPMESKKSNKKFRLLFVGNLTRRKGADLLPKIMKKLGSDYELYFTSGLRTNLSDGLNLENMFPLGKINDKELLRQYNLCDALLFPSRLEGFGYSVAEAMACEKPVVATNCSSLLELIDDGRGGFLCKMDDVGDFVEKIGILGDDENLRGNMGRYNRKKVVNCLNINSMGKQYEQLYKSII